MKVLLVDDEEQILRGVSRMLRAEVDEWEIETALSGSEALGMLEDDEYNVIVSDMRMPEMDGAELLSEISTRYPQLLRVILSGQANRESVLNAVRPMHQYLAKPCDTEKLIAIIRRAEVFQKTIQSSEILVAIGNKDCLPSIPEHLVKLNEVLDSEESTSESVADVLSTDPAISAKVLQLANSSIFGLRHPVVDLARAVNVVGNEMVRSIAISQAIFANANDSSAVCPNRLFQHCCKTAEIAKHISSAEKLDRDTQLLTFTSALLHDIGKILLVNAFPERYRELLARREEGQAIWELELEEFGATHSGVGAYLLELWGLPDRVIEAVGSHHSFEICAGSSIHNQIVYAANWLDSDDDSIANDRLAEKNDGDDVTNKFVEKLNEWRDLVNSVEGDK